MNLYMLLTLLEFLKDTINVALTHFHTTEMMRNY